MRTVPGAFLEVACELTAKHGALLVADEIQTGLGRTGRFLASEVWPRRPDALILGKHLGGGLVPISAMLTSEALFERAYGEHYASAEAHNTHVRRQRDRLRRGARRARSAHRRADRARRRRSAIGSAAGSPHALARHELFVQVKGAGLLVGVELRPSDHPWLSFEHFGVDVARRSADHRRAALPPALQARLLLLRVRPRLAHPARAAAVHDPREHARHVRPRRSTRSWSTYAIWPERSTPSAPSSSAAPARSAAPSCASSRGAASTPRSRTTAARSKARVLAARVRPRGVPRRPRRRRRHARRTRRARPPIVLIHCAAISGGLALEEIDLAAYQQAMAVNVQSAFLAAQWIASRGKPCDIVLVGGLDRNAVAAAADPLRRDPGRAVGTRDGARPRARPARRPRQHGRARRARRRPLAGRSPRAAAATTRPSARCAAPAQPDEAAKAIAWLALENTYIQGKVISVNGGI